MNLHLNCCRCSRLFKISPFELKVNLIARRFSSEQQDPAVTKIRNIKRLVFTFLFGSTFVVALAMKLKRKQEWSHLLSTTSKVSTFGKLTLFEKDHFMIPKEVLQVLEKIEKFKFREDDIVLTSFPKTGTTWLSEIIWLLTNNLDFETAKKVSITERFPYLEWPTPGLTSIANSTTSPRLIKTHLSLSLLFKNQYLYPEEIKPRVVSITREPKDVLVSFFHFSRMNNIIGFEGTFDEFLDMFIHDKVAYGPLASFYHELETASKDENWNQKLLVVKYEDLINNFESVIEKLCKFLNVEMLNEDDVLRMKTFCSFQEMSKRSAVNYSHWDDLGIRKKGESKFMRKGIVGNWKQYFDEEQAASYDKQFQEKLRVLKNVQDLSQVVVGAVN